MEDLRMGYDHFIDRMKRGFWLARKLHGLPIDMMYLPLSKLAEVNATFDVVVTAQTLVHMMSPIEAFFIVASKAREKSYLRRTTSLAPRKRSSLCHVLS